MVKNIIYIDYENLRKRPSVIFGIIPEHDEKICLSGTDTSLCRLEEEDKRAFRRISSKSTLHFILDGKEKVPFYTVPFMDVFAADHGGYYAIVGECVDPQSDSIVYYIDKEESLWIANETFKEFFSRFSESAVYGEKLKSQMKRYEKEDIKIFRTRADAEKEFTIRNISEVL